MPTHSEIIVEQNTQIDSIQRKIDWQEGNNNTFAVTEDGGATFENWTGAGAAAWHTAWRNANASMDGTNGTEHENALYKSWDWWVNPSNRTAEDLASQSITDAQGLINLKAERDTLIADRDAVQASIDAGEIQGDG